MTYSHCKYTVITCDDPAKDKRFTLLKMAGLKECPRHPMHANENPDLNKIKLYSIEPDQYYFYIPSKVTDISYLFSNMYMSGVDMTLFDASNIKFADHVFNNSKFELSSLDDIKFSNLNFKSLISITNFFQPDQLNVRSYSPDKPLELFSLDLNTIGNAENFIGLGYNYSNPADIKIRFEKVIYDVDELNRHIVNTVKKAAEARLNSMSTNTLLVKPPAAATEKRIDTVSIALNEIVERYFHTDYDGYVNRQYLNDAVYSLQRALHEVASQQGFMDRESSYTLKKTDRATINIFEKWLTGIVFTNIVELYHEDKGLNRGRSSMIDRMFNKMMDAKSWTFTWYFSESGDDLPGNSDKSFKNVLPEKEGYFGSYYKATCRITSHIHVVIDLHDAANAADTWSNYSKHITITFYETDASYSDRWLSQVHVRNTIAGGTYV